MKAVKIIFSILLISSLISCASTTIHSERDRVNYSYKPSTVNSKKARVNHAYKQSPVNSKIAEVNCSYKPSAYVSNKQSQANTSQSSIGETMSAILEASVYFAIFALGA